MVVKSPLPEIDFDSEFFDSAEYSRNALQNSRSLAAIFDHTLLQPDASRDQIVRLCEEAAAFRFACAMVNPTWVAVAHSALAGSGVPVGTTVGFPFGAGLSTNKHEEALTLLKLGARELDMVLNLGLLKSGMNLAVQRDIHGVVEIAHDAGALVKVILETSLLNVEEKIRASELAIAAGADFLRTSTGFSRSGATAADVALLRGVAGKRCGIKAAGGIRALADARAMLEAGAERIGASAGVGILQEFGG